MKNIMLLSVLFFSSLAVAQVDSIYHGECRVAFSTTQRPLLQAGPAPIQLDLPAQVDLSTSSEEALLQVFPTGKTKPSLTLVDPGFEGVVEVYVTPEYSEVSPVAANEHPVAQLRSLHVRIVQLKGNSPHQSIVSGSRSQIPVVRGQRVPLSYDSSFGGLTEVEVSCRFE